MKKLFLMLTIAISFSSCVKEEMGPQGPRGPQGPEGNANVKTWFFSSIPSDWQIYGTPGSTDHSKYILLGIPELGTDYVDYGMVMVYLNQGGYYTPLPITAPNGTIDVLIYNYISLGQVEIDIQLSNLATPNTINANYDFKVVAVSGYAKQSNPDLNWKDYKAVAKRFNLE